MKITFLAKVAIFVIIILTSNNAFSQKVGFLNSNTIREKFPDAMQAQQRVQSMTDEWKRELDAMQQKVENLEFEIKKNRLIWTETERQNKESELATLRKSREDYARSVFEPKGKYDEAVATIFTPVEEKIYAAVQKVASEQGFDILVDQSIQPLPYVNYKFDMTVKVLKNLGVDVADLEKDLQERIDKDPRNQQRESKAPARRRGRGAASKPQEERTFEQPQLPDGNNPNPELSPEMKERRINR
ncbi:MAG: OmpH family outer membrane protein [Candidatus Kapabacteria bacterium]|nr:OmpH family outer membrane protein [Ignavibacteriota bacterium]MCW5883495.1 OmpH family outer membrane protein [Candidatus Kapabacteria bacterium]